MANDAYIKGLCPEQTGSVPPLTQRFAKSASSTAALFRGSPYYLVSGEASSSGTGNTDFIKGSVVALFDANGFPVQSLAAADAGYVEGTVSSDQRFRIKVDDTAFAAADVGKNYNITAETGTAATATADGSAYSLVQIDGSTEAAFASSDVNQRQLVVQGLAPLYANNAVATANTEVIVTINPGNYQA